MVGANWRGVSDTLDGREAKKKSSRPGVVES